MSDKNPDPVDEVWGTVRDFSQCNPAGAGQGDVAALLRRVAVSLDELGDVQIQDGRFSLR
jgi:hypothetical protein